MQRNHVLLAVAFLALCSCDRIVITTKPCVESPAKTDLSLAGEWILHDQSAAKNGYTDTRFRIFGPNDTGRYQLVDTTAGRDNECTLVVTPVSDTSDWLLIEFEFPAIGPKRDTPRFGQFYATIKDGWLCFREINLDKLLGVLKRENVNVTQEEPTLLFATLSVAPNDLLRILKTYPQDLMGKTTTYYRKTKLPAQ